MNYALLAYSTAEDAEEREAGEIHPAVRALLDRPSVTGWVRLRGTASATTVRDGGTRTLLTDGPFVESREFLGGVILIDAPDLDAALAIAGEFQAASDGAVIEVRPVLAQELGGA